MSARETERAATIRELASGWLRQGQAARRLGLSVRQVKRLLRRYCQDEAAGLASSKRGRASNRKLPAVAPRAAADKHLEVPFDEVQLSRILSRRTEHRLSKNLTFRERGREYQLLDSRRRRLHGRGAVLCEHLDGQTTVLVDGRTVEHRVFDDGARAPNIADDKTLESRVDAARQARRVRPAADHPWRQAARAAVRPCPGRRREGPASRAAMAPGGGPTAPREGRPERTSADRKGTFLLGREWGHF